MPLSQKKSNHESFSTFPIFGFAMFSSICSETLLCSIRNHEVSSSTNAFKIKDLLNETLWLPDKYRWSTQHYIVNFFRHLPKSNLQQKVIRL